MIAGGHARGPVRHHHPRRRSHPNYPAEFDVFIDADRDGRDDYAVFNLENGGFGVTGQNVVAVRT